MNDGSRESTDIFLSYTGEDRPHAAQVAKALADLGWSVWWDRELLAGQDFEQQIEGVLETARAVVVLWSDVSVGQDFVRNEVNVGLRRKTLVPVRIDAVAKKDIPLSTRHIQTTDLIDWNGEPSSEAFGRLVKALASRIGQPPSVKPDPQRKMARFALASSPREVQPTKLRAKPPGSHTDSEPQPELEPAPPPPVDEEPAPPEPASAPFWTDTDRLAKVLIAVAFLVLAGWAAVSFTGDNRHTNAARRTVESFLEVVAPDSSETSPATDSEIARQIAGLVEPPFFFGADRLATREAIEGRFRAVLARAADSGLVTLEDSDALRMAAVFLAEVRKSAAIGRDVLVEEGLIFDARPTEDEVAEDPFFKPEIDLEDYVRTTIRLAGVPPSTFRELAVFTVMDLSGDAPIRGIKIRPVPRSGD
jgi:hypothetical protein